MVERDLPTQEQILDYRESLFIVFTREATRLARIYQKTGVKPGKASLFPEANQPKTHTLWRHSDGQTIEVDFGSRKIIIKQQTVERLTSRESKLLEKFLSCNNKTLTHVEIAKYISPGWGNELNSINPAVEKPKAAKFSRPLVTLIRKKLRNVHPALGERIILVHGTGYYWATQTEIEKDLTKQSR